jgi:hypothetical protein
MQRELDRIRACARHSIGRAFLFALLAIGAAMSGLIVWPSIAFQLGGVSALLTAAILMLRAQGVARRSYRSTETWILLGRSHQFPESIARRAFAEILGETYRQFALHATILGLGMLALALVTALAER